MQHPVTVPATVSAARCKEHVGATLGTERSPASECPSSLDPVDFRFSAFLSLLVARPHHRLLFKNKALFKLTTQDDLRVPITVLSALTAPFLSCFLSSIVLVLLSRTTLPIQKPLPRGSRTLISLSHFSFPFMRLHLLFIPITGTRSLLLYKT